MERRTFLKATAATALGTAAMQEPLWGMAHSGGRKKKIALVGTGIRGIGLWGQELQRGYGDLVEFVGLCDKNPGRLELAKQAIGIQCRVYTDFEQMMAETRPETVIVTTVDATHHLFIIRAMELGADVITEKPLTTDETKCEAILEAEKRTGRVCTVAFNYRYGTLFTAIKEELAKNPIGPLNSVDFNWYLNVYHGASYFRRWHGERAHSGTLLVHKATHHFDLLNWFIEADPVEVMAYGSLEHYGKNNPFRGKNCRTCPHQSQCDYYWDIREDQVAMELYAKNEHHDGYIRDNCLWRPEIDIFDKMSVQIKYANDVLVNYSLTTYSPYEGWKIAFNGKTGRMESWEDLPWRAGEKLDQAQLHAAEMSQSEQEAARYDEIFLMKNFSKDYEIKKVRTAASGHGGGDNRLLDRIFRNAAAPDPYGHAAGTRDGAMSCLIGIAARKSIDEHRPIRIEDLTSIKPHPRRGR